MATIELLNSFAEAYNQHDVEGIMRHMTDDCVFVSYFGADPWGARFEGYEAVRTRVEAGLRDFPDARWKDVRHFVCGDRGVSEWTFSGTSQIEGRFVERHGCDVFTFREGKICVKDTFHKWVSA
jgi:ketosteroid isomerase-like protein